MERFNPKIRMTLRLAQFAKGLGGLVKEYRWVTPTSEKHFHAIASKPATQSLGWLAYAVTVI
jgi:hypothetical protein